MFPCGPTRSATSVVVPHLRPVTFLRCVKARLFSSFAKMRVLCLNLNASVITAVSGLWRRVWFRAEFNDLDGINDSRRELIRSPHTILDIICSSGHN